MKTRQTLAMLSAILLVGAANAGEWENWFSDGTTAGFSIKGGKQVFTLNGNVLEGHVVKGERNGFLCTDKAYGDFELEYEAWIDATQNSGVQIRSECVDTPITLDLKNGKTKKLPAGVVHGYQVELDPSHPARTADIYDEERRGWLGSEKTGTAFHPGQWNRFRVVCQGDHLQTWLNGVPVADLHDNMTRKGFIGFQVHASPVEGLSVKWRNVRFRETGEKER